MARDTILFIVTSHSQLGNTGKSTGYYLPELAHPHKVLSAHYKIRFATPAGGKAPVDPDSVEYFRDDPVCAEFLANAQHASALETTERLEDVVNQADQYCGVFFPGGHGLMFDLTDNKDAHTIVRHVYEHGGIVGGVCHGPAGFVNLKLSSGQWLVQGHRVTSFSNEEEDMMKLSEAMPFLLETRLVENGGEYHKASELWGAHVEGKGTRLLTGQNPKSSAPLAEAILAELRRHNL